MYSKEISKLQKRFYQTHDYLDDQKKNRVLVLGIGNYLMGDEGVGVHVIQALDRVKLPLHVDILDGGTGSFDLMPILAKYSMAVLIDATLDGLPPGSVRVLYPRFSSDFPTVLSAHDVGLKDMIDALEFKNELPRMTLITVSIKAIQPMSIELSNPVRRGLSRVIKVLMEMFPETITEQRDFLKGDVTGPV